MELCSGYSPKRSRTSMCKNTDELMGIPVPLPSVLPPIENWYVVGRNIKTGTCSIYSSWKNYQEQTEIAPPSASKTTTSPNGTTRKKRTTEDAANTELAAFPTVAQAIAYVKNIGPQTPTTPIASSVTVPSSPATNSTGKTNSTRTTIQTSPDDSASQSSTPARDADRKSPLSPSRKRPDPSATTEAKKDSLDESTKSSDDDAKKSPPSPAPSEGSASKKRKLDLRSIRTTIPTFTNRPLRMSTTSDTIDIGAPPKAKKQGQLSSLDALAMVASARPSKTSPRDSILEATKAATVANTSSGSKNPKNGEEARLSPDELLLAAIPKGGFKTFSGGKVAPTIASRAISKKQEEERKKLIMEKIQKEDEALVRQIQEEEKKIKILEARKESLSLSKSRTPLSDLKIPEVPKGFVSGANGLQTMANIDHKLMMGSGLSGMGSSSISTLSSRLSKFDSFPLGSGLSSHLQQQQQHLQNLRHETSLYRNKANLLSLQLQSSRNPLIQHLRGNGQHLNFRERLQQSAMIDLASVSSDSEHSKMTLKRRNGLSSEASSPLTMGAASILSKKTESK